MYECMYGCHARNKIIFLVWNPSSHSIFIYINQIPTRNNLVISMRTNQMVCNIIMSYFKEEEEEKKDHVIHEKVVYI